MTPAEEVILSLMLSMVFAAAMIHWTRQIKEVLSSQDNFEMSENSGPLEEIEFWKNRLVSAIFLCTGIKRQTRSFRKQIPTWPSV